MKRRYILLSLFALALAPQLEAFQISGPMLGYIADPVTLTVRPIIGIPGASSVGKPVSLVKVRRAVVAVKGDYALAVSDDNSEVLLLMNLSGAASVSPIAGVYPGGDALALSPDGSSAVAHSLSSARIQIIAGLPSNPVVRYELDTGALGSLSALAVNQYEEVFAAFSNGETDTLYLLTADASPRFIANVGNVSGITFATGGDRALAVDRLWNQVLLFQDLSSTAASIRLAGSADGISDPIGVVLSKDTKTAFVPNRGSGTVTLVNLAGGGSRDVSCQCQPTAVQTLYGDSIFALTERSDEPLVLFDGTSAEYPRVLIVPPDAPTD